MMIWIPGNVPSLKNSKVSTSKGVFASKTVRKYLQQLGVQDYSVRQQTVKDYVKRPNQFRELEDSFRKVMLNKTAPYEFAFHFVRGSRHKFDFHNAVQIIADLMVAHGYIDDDNMDFFIPSAFKMKGQFYTYNKENPGVFIKIK